MNFLYCLIGIVGSAIFSYIFYKKGITRKKLIYTIKQENLITNNLSEINGLIITYQNKQIEDLTTTTINIKSVGKDNIEMSDFAKSSPLCIKTDGQFLFKDDIGSTLTYNSNPSNLIELCVDNSSSTVQLKYDYFKQNDLIILNVLHTGNLTVAGELKKGKILQSDVINKKNIWDIVFTIALFIGLVLILLISILENGLGDLVLLYLNFILGIIGGAFLIDYFYKKKHTSDSGK